MIKQTVFDIIYFLSGITFPACAVSAKWFGVLSESKYPDWKEPIRSSYSWQLPYYHHSSGFAHRALAGAYPCEPLESLQVCLRRFLAFYEGIDIGFLFRLSLAMKVTLSAVMFKIRWLVIATRWVYCPRYLTTCSASASEGSQCTTHLVL
jgi:hypothetical protein